MNKEQGKELRKEEAKNYLRESILNYLKRYKGHNSASLEIKRDNNGLIINVEVLTSMASQWAAEHAVESSIREVFGIETSLLNSEKEESQSLSVFRISAHVKRL